MSHTTTLSKLPIKDLTALNSAVSELAASGINIRITENIKPRAYYQNQIGVCDHVVELPGCKYDVGLAKRATNDGYDFSFDAWSGEIQRQIGDSRCEDRNIAPIAQLAQAYSRHATINAATAQGYAVGGASTEADGTVKLILTGM